LRAASKGAAERPNGLPPFFLVARPRRAPRRAKWSVLLFVACALSLSTVWQVTQAQPGSRASAAPAWRTSRQPCFAYLHGGDVWFRCGGTKARVTRTAKIDAFAVLGGDLAIENDYGVVRLYALPTGRLLHELPPGRGAYWLWVSCGELWVQDNGTGAAATLPDGERPSAVPCMGAIPRGAHVHDYMVSPHGRYLAYSQYLFDRANHWKLCVVRAGGTPSCIDVYQGGNISVAESGVIIFDAANGDDCLTNGVGALIPRTAKAPPTYDQSAVCSAVFTWSPTVGRQGPFAEYSTQPQWLSPVEAAALGKLAASPAARRLR